MIVLLGKPKATYGIFLQSVGELKNKSDTVVENVCTTVILLDILWQIVRKI